MNTSLYDISSSTLCLRVINNFLLKIKIVWLVYVSWNFALILTRLYLYIFKNSCKLSRYVFNSYLQYNPLKVWLYRSGFARFSNTRFSLDSIEDTCILLILYPQLMFVMKIKFKQRHTRSSDVMVKSLIYSENFFNISKMFIWQMLQSRRMPRTMTPTKAANGPHNSWGNTWLPNTE